VIQEHCEVVKMHQEEEEHRSSAVIPVDVLRNESILSGEGQKGHYASLEESRSCMGSVGWTEGWWETGGRGSFLDGGQPRAGAG
jgi:hypothetical protein